jgi:hypothetical protein
MELNNGVASTGSNVDDTGAIHDVLSELSAWRHHVNRKDAADDEQLLRTFTNMGEVATIVQQRTELNTQCEN